MIKLKTRILKTLLIFVVFFYSIEAFSNTKKVTLLLPWLNQFQFAGYYMAKEKGYYDSVSLNVNIEEPQDSSLSKSFNSVINTQNTYSIYNTSLLTKHSAENKILLLSSILQSSPYLFISLKSSKIENLSSFHQKNIMARDDAETKARVNFLLNQKNLNIHNIIHKDFDFKYTSLINEEVDILGAYISNEPYMLKQKNIDYTIHDINIDDISFYSDILYTSKDNFDNNPEEVNSFRSQSLRGWHYAFNNIEETVELILKKYNTQNKTREALIFEANELKKLAFYNTSNLGEININKLQKMYNLHNYIGNIKNNYSLEDIVFNNDKFLDTKLSKRELAYLKEKKSINMCVDPNWMPLEKIQNKEHVGIASDYISIIKEKFNLPINLIQTKTWHESLEYAKNRKCDILSLAMETKKRKEYLNFTKNYLSLPLVIVTKNGTQYINDLASLKRKKIGITKDYAFVEILRKKYPNLNLIEVDNLKNGLNKILDNELFGYVDNIASISYLVQREFNGELKISGKFNTTWDLSIAVRNDDYILLNILDKAISTITLKEHQSILNKWLNMPFENKQNYMYLKRVLIGIFILILFFIYKQYLLKETNKKLSKRIDKKTFELRKLNQSLELKIKEAIEENSKKDTILNEQLKMASMSEMLKNIAHQWRQPLSVISSSSTGLIYNIQYNQNFSLNDSIEILESLDTSAQDLSKTIDEFSSYLQNNKSKKEFDINDVLVKQKEMFCKNFLYDNIEIILENNSILINNNQNDLLQVVFNILNNARYALNNSPVDEKLIFMSLTKKENHAIIKIKDNAGGVSKSNLNKIFEIYFTTKHQSIGTGMGLYTSYQIIKNNFSGNIIASNERYTYEDKEYTGALFTISLPII